MNRTSELFFGIATLGLMGVVLWHMLFVVSHQPKTVPIYPDVPTNENNFTAKQSEFRQALESIVVAKNGRRVEGYEPIMFVLALPGLQLEDFNKVAAMTGEYEYSNGVLQQKVPQGVILHTAAAAISESGMNTLLDNVANRLLINLNTASVPEIIAALKQNQIEVTPPVSNEEIIEPVACTMDAKLCPDGSYVGRTAPNCEFAACPTSISETKPVIECSEESKKAEVCTMIYAPVCAAVDVQCVTTPCEPVQQTFASSCTACAQENVSSYTQGECAVTQ